MTSNDTPRKRAVRKHIRRALVVLAVVAAVPLSYYLYVGVWESNFHAVLPGQVYRSGAPSEDDIEDWSATYGLKSVVDLRADGVTRTYPQEQAACNEAGVKLIYIKTSASHRPSGKTLRKLIRIIETAPRPVLLHCQGGADRSGLAGFIAAMAIGGQDYYHAEKQFSWRYFHLQTDLPITRVLHEYRHWCRDNRLGMGGWKQFRRWAMHVYDRPDPGSAATGPSQQT